MDDQNMQFNSNDQHARSRVLLGSRALEKLASSHVAVFGIGGVGGAVCEALARSGVGSIDLIDADTVEESNINRQFVATQETIGRYKTEVMAERIKAINPECIVKTYELFYLPETAGQIDLSGCDYLIDAIDTVTAKIDLICRANEAGIPIISSMGAGNRLDPSSFTVADLFSTHNDPLAKVMRRELKARGITSLDVVWSDEKPVTSARTPGSVSFVPPVAGMIMAGHVIKKLIQI